MQNRLAELLGLRNITITKMVDLICSMGKL